MPANVRVMLAPIAEVLPFGVVVTGTTVSFQPFGKGEPFAPSEPQPAKLTFSVGFVEAPRSVEQAGFTVVATLEGEMSAGDDGKPVFIVSEGTVLEPDDPDVVPTLGRSLDVLLDPGSFQSAEEGLQLHLPPEPVDCEFAEIAVMLEINDEIIASPDDSDRLDFPLYQVTQVLLRYEDETPMANAKFRAQGSGHTVEGTTDEDGVATVHLPRFGRGRLRIILDEFEETTIA